MGVPPDPKNDGTPAAMDRSCIASAGTLTIRAASNCRSGITVRDLVDKYGGGVWKGRKAKGCIPGGISMGLMTEAEFDTLLDFSGPGKVGCLGLGTAAVTIFDDRRVSLMCCTTFVAFLARIVRPVYACREGTGWMLKIWIVCVAARADWRT